MTPRNSFIRVIAFIITLVYTIFALLLFFTAPLGPDIIFPALNLITATSLLVYTVIAP